MMNNETIRTAILEFIGWTDLTRKGKFGEIALRGTSPEGKENQIAPNPVSSLDALHEIEARIARGPFCGSYYERYENAIYEGGLALASAAERAKQLYYIILPESED